MPALHSISNNIGDTGVSSLSSALEVNSTLTSLDLRMCFVWIVFSVFCFVISLVCYFDLWWTRLENQEYHHCQNHWRLIHLSLNWTWEWDCCCCCCFHNWDWEFYWADRNNIGDSGLSSLSEGLKVNSSLTSLTLVFTFYFCIYSLSLFLYYCVCELLV